MGCLTGITLIWLIPLIKPAKQSAAADGRYTGGLSRCVSVMGRRNSGVRVRVVRHALA